MKRMQAMLIIVTTALLIWGCTQKIPEPGLAIMKVSSKTPSYPDTSKLEAI